MLSWQPSNQKILDSGNLVIDRRSEYLIPCIDMISFLVR
jgi:hypothetical protein